MPAAKSPSLEFDLPPAGQCGESRALELGDSRKIRLSVPKVDGLQKPIHLSVQQLRDGSFYGINGAHLRVIPNAPGLLECELPASASVVRVLSFSELEAGTFSAKGKIEAI